MAIYWAMLSLDEMKMCMTVEERFERHIWEVLKKIKGGSLHSPEEGGLFWYRVPDGFEISQSKSGRDMSSGEERGILYKLAKMEVIQMQNRDIGDYE